MKVDRAELIQKIQARLREVDNDIDHFTEELEYVTKLKEDLEEVEDYLLLHKDWELDTEPPFRPTQVSTLKEAGLDHIAEQQKELSQKFEINGIDILDLIDW